MSAIHPDDVASRRRTFGESLRSVGVGGVATVADLLVLSALVGWLAWSPVAANVPALVVGLAIQFAGNKWIAFRNCAVDARSLARQSIGFLGVETGAFTLNAIAYHLVVSHVPDAWLAARIGVGAAVYLLWSLPLWRRLFAAPTTVPHEGVTS